MNNDFQKSFRQLRSIHDSLEHYERDAIALLAGHFRLVRGRHALRRLVVIAVQQAPSLMPLTKRFSYENTQRLSSDGKRFARPLDESRSHVLNLLERVEAGVRVWQLSSTKQTWVAQPALSELIELLLRWRKLMDCYLNEHPELRLSTSELEEVRRLPRADASCASEPL